MSAASAISMSDGNGVGASTSMLTPPSWHHEPSATGVCGTRRLWRAGRGRSADGIPCSGAFPRRAPPRRGRRGRRHRAARAGRDGARRRRRDRRQGPPARAGRHRHRQVAGLPRARGAARDGLGHADRRRHRDPRAPGPDRRPRHAAAGRVPRPAAGPAADLRPGQGAAQLPVRPQARGRLPRRRRRHPDVGGGGRPAGLTARRRGGAAARLGRGHRVRRPRRAGAGGVGAGLASGVGVSAEECLGGRCPMVSECFVERSREAARDVDVIVTNHSFMAIDAFEGRQMLPEHDVLVVDEGHELVDRVTSTITDEVTPGMVRAAAKRAGRQSDSSLDHGRGRRPARVGARAGPRGAAHRHPRLARPGPRPGARHRPRRAERAQAAAGRGARRRPPGGARRRRRGLRERLAHPRGARARRRVAQPRPAPWAGAAGRTDERGDARARQGLLRAHRGAHLGHARARWVVRRRRRHHRPARRGCAAPGAGSTSAARSPTPSRASPTWPGTCPRPAATAWPPRPSTRSRPWCVRPAVARWACSRRCARPRRPPRRCASGSPTSQGDIAFLCQGEDQISTLVRQFARDPRTCLFGTLSLWQGVDVPGSSCQLVIIDRIPFPRPTTRSPRRARRPSRGWAATASWRSRPRTRRCGWRRVRVASSDGPTTAASSRSSTTG